MDRNDHRDEKMNIRKDSNLRNWQAELDSFVIYKTLSKIEKSNSKGELFKKLSLESMVQAEIWKKSAAPTSDTWTYQISTKLKFLIFLIRILGPRFTIHFLPALKVRGISTYMFKDHYTGPGTNEKIHSKIKSATNLRAAIFGINDGLVSSASLVFGMVGAGSDNRTIIMAGISGLLAGSFSMAVGEYVSVKSQTEMYENQIEIEAQELKEFPQEEAKELSLIYQAKGMDKETADKISQHLVSNPEMALDTLAREELGLNPSELGSAIGASLSSFLSFSIGALIPLLPYFFFQKSSALSISITTSTLALFMIGIMISFITGKSALMNGVRMCFLGWMAGLTTYLIGFLLGTAVT